jgi:serine protease Do
MDNYLSDFDGNNGGARNSGGGGKMILLACVLCALVSALVSWGVCTSLLGDNGGSTATTTVDDSSGNSTQIVVTQDDADTINVAQNVSPAVVFISNIQNVRSIMSFWSNDSDVTEQVASTGSGVIYSTDGYIITNNHVVDGAEKISVTLQDGNSYMAEVVGTDERTDLAVIKIDCDEELTAATFGDSDSLVVGETAIAIGNPGGEHFANSLTKGVISGLNRSVTTSEGTVLTLVQTDAAINPGNSGGALCNSRGEVIGINTVKISMTGYEGMGFAIPSNDVLTICKELIENGKIARPALGVNIIANITPQIAYYNNLSVDYGVMISPSKGSAAALAGLENYDIITALDGEKVETYSDLQAMVLEHEIGDTVTVTVLRGSEFKNFTVTLQELAE